jgi:multiple antibiotic resistance protein
MKTELFHFLSTFIAVFFILDPFAAVPVYLMLTERFSAVMTARIRKKATLIAGSILLVFALTGLAIFKLFGITLPAFQIAGGILLLLFGLAQLNANRPRVREEERTESMERDDVSVFPLGTPLLAGPGSISTVVLMSTEAGNPVRKGLLVLAILLAVAATYLVLRAAPRLLKVLGRTGLNILTRLMGMILTAIAVQFILNGLKASFEILSKSSGG